MLPSQHFPFVITILGVPLTELEARDVEEVVVNTSLHMPSMFTLRLRDEDLLGAAIAVAYKYIDNPRYTTLGAPITIRAIQDSEMALPVPLPIFVGEITAVEAEFDGGRATLVLRGYDKSHRLHQGKKTATYQFMPDTAIVAKVTAAAGVPCTPMIPPGAPREYVLQNNQTDMEFLRELLERNGCNMTSNALGVLVVKPIAAPLPGPPGPLLTFKQDLYSFRPRISLANQRAGVMVQAWDAKLKMPMSAPGIPIPAVQGGPQMARHLATAKLRLGTSKEVVADQPLGNPVGEALPLAMAKAAEIAHRFLQADGECRGHPLVQAGATITLLGLGTTFSGLYQVSSATHRYAAGAGYVTAFSVTGSEPDTLADLVTARDGDDRRGRFHGVVTGTVTNNIDPLQLGRVKVKLPYLGALPPVESNWCRIASPWAGGKMSGFMAIPEINDEVLVAFEHGDANTPYVVGQLWSLKDMPPSPSGTVVIGGLVTKRIIKSRSGHVITLSDMPGKEGISIVDKTMLNKIELDSIKNSLAISTMGDVQIDCLNFKVNAKATLELKAVATAKVSGTAGLELKSAAKTSVIGNAAVEIKGGMTVDIKTLAGGSISLKGPQISMNNGALEVM